MLNISYINPIYSGGRISSYDAGLNSLLDMNKNMAVAVQFACRFKLIATGIYFN